MKDRVWPSQETTLGDNKEFAGIDYADVQRKLAQFSGMPISELAAKSKTDDLPVEEAPEDDIMAELRAILQIHDEETEQIEELAEKVGLDFDDESVEGPAEPGMKKEGYEPSITASARNTMQKFAFTSPDQFDADAVIAAEASGDTELKTAMLHERHMRREAVVHEIESKLEEQAQEEAKKEILASRANYRQALVERVKNVVAVKTASATKKTSEKTSIEFKTVSGLNNAEKSIFAEKAKLAGFPEEYVNCILGNNANAVTSEETTIKDVMAADLNMNVKKAALTGLSKTANLQGEQLARVLDYWKNTLGYGDQKWIDDLFTTQY